MVGMGSVKSIPEQYGHLNVCTLLFLWLQLWTHYLVGSCIGYYCNDGHHVQVHIINWAWNTNVLWDLNDEMGRCVRRHSSWTPPKCSKLCTKYRTQATRKRTIQQWISSDETYHTLTLMLYSIFKGYLWMWLFMSHVPVQWTVTGHWVLPAMFCWFLWLSTLNLSNVNPDWFKVWIILWKYKYG